MKNIYRVITKDGVTHIQEMSIDYINKNVRGINKGRYFHTCEHNIKDGLLHFTGTRLNVIKVVDDSLDYLTESLRYLKLYDKHKHDMYENVIIKTIQYKSWFFGKIKEVRVLANGTYVQDFEKRITIVVNNYKLTTGV